MFYDLKKTKLWRVLVRERKRLLLRRWRSNNPDKVRAYDTAYRERRREEIKRNRRAWYHKNKKRARTAAKLWDANNSDKLRARYKGARQRIKNDPQRLAAQKERQRRYRVANKEKIRKAECRRYRERGYIKTRQKWRQNNRDKCRVYDARQRQRIERKLRLYLRSRLWSAIKNNSKTGSAVRDLGCSITAFKAHITSLFLPKMSWSNYGEWHLDHKIPLAAFDLADRTQLLSAVHYSNIQPLWKFDNLSKGAKIL